MYKEYKECIYDNGDSYKGETADSMRCGQGEYIWKNGQRYVGEFNNDRIEGSGTIYYTDGSVYTGQWKDEKKSGLGEYTWKSGQRYTGEFRSDKINGTGTMYCANGDVYTGQWKDEKRSGEGEYTWKDGRRYVGEFYNDKINGTGTMYYTDVSVYTGQWKDELRDGKGELRLAEKIEPEVPFENGTYDFGSRLTGKWSKGNLEGLGYCWITGIPYPHWFDHGIDKGDYLDLSAAERTVTDTSVRGKFLGQSGFWLQLPDATLIFDCYIGKLPPTRRDKPLIVFISHMHSDHFNRHIFHLMDSFEKISFVIGIDSSSEKDFTYLVERLEQQIPGLDDRCFFVKGGDTLDFGNIGVKVQALPSTDMGTAFLVNAGGKTIFHAGDLWIQPFSITSADGKSIPAEVMKQIRESPEYAEICEGERNRFRQYTAPLNGIRIDLAMLPLDPRFGNNGPDSMLHYLSIADISAYIPMHLWENFSFLDDFIKAEPEAAKRMIKPVLNGRNAPSSGVLRCTDGKGYFSF